jgi:hypothetical protein
MYDLFLFSDENKFEEIEQELINKDKLESFLYNSFYSDLITIGDDRFIKTKINGLTNQSKVLSLKRAIKYFSQSNIEEYEKCSHLQNILNKIKK